MPRTTPTLEPTPQGQQYVLPGAERSARQAAAAREAEGHGRSTSRAPQLAPGGLFATRQPEQTDIEQAAKVRP